MKDTKPITDRSPAGAVAALGCPGFRPPARLTPWAWAAKNVSIQNSDRGPSFDPDQTPWWKAPMECAADFDTRWVIIVAPTGCGKTTVFEALIAWILSESPGNLLYASQTDTDASFWVETRLMQALKSCKMLDGYWSKDRNKTRKLEIVWPHMAGKFGGANISNFQEYSARWLLGDECWAWGGKDAGGNGLIREFSARHHNRWNRKGFLVSQGTKTETEFHAEWCKTPMADFSWRCKKCHHPQPYSFDSLRYDRIEREDGSIDEQATAETCRMECVACRAQYPDQVQVRRALADSNMGNGMMGYIATNSTPLHGYAGFHVDSLAVWWVPWASEVMEFLEAQRLLKRGVVDKLRQWREKRRAGFWDDSMADAKVPLVRSATFSKLDHEDGEPIEGEAARFLTIDVQGDHYWCLVIAWRNGGTGRLLWEGFVQSDGGAESELVRLQERYRVPAGQTLIDIGFEQDRIFDLMARHGWTGVKGDGLRRSYSHRRKNGRPVERLYSTTQRARSKAGPIVRFVFVATNPIKDIAHRILTAEETQLELPSDLSKTFENHTQAERREAIRSPKTGQETFVWVTKNRSNHLWDCLCYSIAAALIFSLFKTNETA